MPALIHPRLAKPASRSILLLLTSMLLCGCPRPLDRLGAERDSIPGRNSGVAARTARSEAGGKAAADTQAANDEVTEIPEAPATDPPAGSESGEQGLAGPQQGPLPQAPPGGPPGISDFLRSKQSAGTAGAEPPSGLPLSQEALVGDWNVYAMRLAGESSLIEPGERWIISLQQDSSAKVKQWLGEKQFVRSGRFSLAGERLTLELGKDGTETYSAKLLTADICLLSRLDGEGGLLYCASGAAKSIAELSPRYESDFGEINFSRSGPSFWVGSYGAPEGKLLLSLDGSIASGQWEQGGESGFAIFSFSANSFSGVWWKKDSAGVDGLWQGQLSSGGV